MMNLLTSQVSGEDGLLLDQQQLKMTQHISTNTNSADEANDPKLLSAPCGFRLGSRSPRAPCGC